MSFDASEIARLRALCAAATPGLWRDYFKVTTPDATVVVAYGPECSSKWPDGRATAEFIAAARTALPAALDEIERLRGCLGKAVCVWCGFETSGDDKEEKVADHILLFCDKIPWRAVEAENDLLREEKERLRKINDEAVRLLHMLDRPEARHPDVALFLDGLDPDAGVAK